ncbi:Wadjet anti-phage system protein JetD domain-containing protein [Niallia sp. Krafla_26]|uniref:Wadjet anti-phage system protein JetD domain-containing protein n=1 Tax=Niallia sp. Krafla_26 TaxID=3064703 RepID=UPI003D17202A
MEAQLISLLKAWKKKTIHLSELEQHITENVDYVTFAQVILKLEESTILTRVKTHGENHKNPSLAITYRIQKNLLKENLHEKLKSARLQFHPSINLEAYFQLSEEQWEKDLPYIHKVDHYIRKNGFPTSRVPAPERSFEIVENEKWITEGGQEVLERIKMWEPLRIMPVSDPLMFAVNPHQLKTKTHLHLIVENKTTYQGLLPALQDSSFTSLIYGSGKKVIKSIEHFAFQLPLPKAKHIFYYFGDLDYEGILIWHLLSKKIPVKPALTFYQACLTKPYAFGKQNQRAREEALKAFFPFFTKEEQEKMEEMFQNGGYYPQEIVKTDELQHIWRNTSWKSMI